MPAKRMWLVFSKASWDTDFQNVGKVGDSWRIKTALGPGGGKLVPWKVRSLDRCLPNFRIQADVIVRKGRPGA